MRATGRAGVARGGLTRSREGREGFLGDGARRGSHGDAEPQRFCAGGDHEIEEVPRMGIGGDRRWDGFLEVKSRIV